MRATISVGILTRDRKELLLRAIRSVSAQGVEGVETVVVDAASTDGTAEAVRELHPEVRLVRLPRNLGCPGGRNHVFANCTGDVVVCLDDDGYLGEGTLEGVRAAFEADPSLGILALRQCYTDRPGEGRAAAGGERREASEFSGGVCALRRSMIEATGGYPEDFFLYAEESWLALKALDAGYRIVSDPSLVVWHPRVGGSDPGDGTRDYLRFRNPLLVVLRLFPGLLMAKYLFLRTGSYALVAARRGTLLPYAAAVLHVLSRLPSELLSRRPCRPATVREYFRLRGKVVEGRGEAP